MTDRRRALLTAANLMRPVGGVIARIYSTSDEDVKFFDSSFSPLSDVAVGDQPAYYQIVSGSSPKYLVAELSRSYARDKQWAPANGTFIGATSTTNGRENTDKVMAWNNGEYAQKSSLVWGWLAAANQNALGGCSDWYIPSSSELSIVWNAKNSDGDYLLDNRSMYIASSTEDDETAFKSIWGGRLQSHSKSSTYWYVPVRTI